MCTIYFEGKVHAVVVVVDADTLGFFVNFFVFVTR